MSEPQQQTGAWFFQALLAWFERLENGQRALVQEQTLTPQNRQEFSQEVAEMLYRDGLRGEERMRIECREWLSQDLLAFCIRYLIEQPFGTTAEHLEEWTICQSGWYGGPHGREDANDTATSPSDTAAGDQVSVLRSGYPRPWRANYSRRPGRPGRGD